MGRWGASAAKVSALNSMIKNDLIWKFTFDFTALFFDKLVTEGLVTHNRSDRTLKIFYFPIFGFQLKQIFFYIS